MSSGGVQVVNTKEVKWEEPACRHIAEAKLNDYRPVCTTRGWVYQDGGRTVARFTF